MKILVTGGAGFIGSHLTDELLSRGHEVSVLDNLVNGSKENLAFAFQNKKFTFIQGDILDPKTCTEAVRDRDVVYHLACLGVRHSLHSPFENHRVNAEGTLRVLEAMRGKKARFFYISSSEIYGQTNQFPITEEALPRPTTVYGASKLTGEHYTRAYQRSFGLDAVILRIFNNYGPRAHYEGDAGELIPRAIVSAFYDKKPVVFGDGKATRDFFYVKDTARALADLLDIRNLSGETLNIGAGKEMTIQVMVEKILERMGRKDLGIEYLDARPADLPRLWVNATKFYVITGFKPAYILQEGLDETISYYKEMMKTKNLISKVSAVNWTK